MTSNKKGLVNKGNYTVREHSNIMLDPPFPMSTNSRYWFNPLPLIRLCDYIIYK